MIQDKLKIEAEARRFFLGEMSEDARAAFEANFVADDDLFEQTRVVEDELIESYARGTLPGDEREKFERAFLATEARRRRVEFTRSMLDRFAAHKEIAHAKNIEAADESSSVWNSIAGFFKNPGFAFGAAAAILLIVFGGWFLTRNAGRTEIVQQNADASPTPFETILPKANQSPQTNQNAATDSGAKTPETVGTNKNGAKQKNDAPDKNTNAQNSNAQKEERSAPVVNPVFALVAGGVRSEGRTRELNLPKNAANVSLQLNLESADYKIYRAEIVDADGNIISKSGGLKAKSSKVNFSVPAARLVRGDYIVKLSARNPQNEIESVADYAFRVNRQ